MSPNTETVKGQVRFESTFQHPFLYHVPDLAAVLLAGDNLFHIVGFDCV